MSAEGGAASADRHSTRTAERQSVRSVDRIPVTYVVTLVPVAAALNLVGGTINEALRLPTFLDMIGTAVAAIVLGPWWGALVGVLTNVGGAFLLGPIGIPFALANVAGALVWGYGVRSWGMGASLTRFFALNILVALAVSLVATPIVVFVFGGATGHSSDAITAAFVQAGQELVTSVFASNVIVTIGDKVIAGFVALAIIEALPPAMTAGLVLPAPPGMRGVLLAAGGAAIGVALVLVFVLITPTT
jgi:energy-coupling factor transport system substrate-specific component